MLGRQQRRSQAGILGGIALIGQKHVTRDHFRLGLVHLIQSVGENFANHPPAASRAKRLFVDRHHHRICLQ